MKAQNLVAFEFEKEDRMYRLEMPNNAPLGEAYEAAASFLGEIVRLINEHSDKVKPLDSGAAIEVEAEVEEEK